MPNTKVSIRHNQARMDVAPVSSSSMTSAFLFSLTSFGVVGVNSSHVGGGREGFFFPIFAFCAPCSSIGVSGTIIRCGVVGGGVLTMMGLMMPAGTRGGERARAGTGGGGGGGGGGGSGSSSESFGSSSSEPSIARASGLGTLPLRTGTGGDGGGRSIA